VSEKPESPSPSHQPRRQRETARNNKNRVISYLAILFAAAFLLLLMSYFMQQRTNNEVIDGLTQSLNSIHSLQNLVDANEALEKENSRLEGENRALEQERDVLAGEALALKDQAAAMQYFWQINEAYARGRYKLCRSLIEEMEAQIPVSGEDAKLSDFLSKENITGTERFSPYDRYMEIYHALY